MFDAFGNSAVVKTQHGCAASVSFGNNDREWLEPLDRGQQRRSITQKLILLDVVDSADVHDLFTIDQWFYLVVEISFFVRQFRDISGYDQFPAGKFGYPDG